MMHAMTSACTHHELPEHTGSMRHLLRLATPLILASSGHAVRLLSDRIMLARYSQEAIAAAMPAGLACFVLMSLFIGTGGYVNAFVSQYAGAGQWRKIGQAVWQGLFLAVLGGVLVALLGQTGPILFRWMGHRDAVQVQQILYFQTLCRLSMPPILLATLLSFWSGRGITKTVMVIELTAALVNVSLNSLLIYGRGGFPEMGIFGAAIATGTSNMIGLLIALVLFFHPRNRQRFNTLPRKLFHPKLLVRLLRFGLPNGLQFMLDIAAFNVFVAFLGRFGMMELEATNIAFGVNTVVFIPMIGLGMSTSILTGQCVGGGRTDLVQRALRNALLLGLTYSALLGSVFIGAPDMILTVFRRSGDPDQAAALVMAAGFLRYIAAYLILANTFLTYSHAIKGAGDTRFSLGIGVALSWGSLVAPCYVAARLHAGIWVMWQIFVAHIALAGLVFYWRYRTGKWKHMHVIEFPPTTEHPESVTMEALSD